MSKAKTVPEVPVSLAATCDQLPGALPKSASTAGFDYLVFFVDFQKFVCGTGAVAVFLRHMDVVVVDVFVQPRF